MIYDVAVVGAGPAGALAALTLGQAGARVALLEKHALPRYKTCGGGLLRRARALLPAPARDLIEHESFTAELCFPHSGLAFAVRRPDPLVGMTMRAGLDAALADAARTAGASLRARCEVRGVRLGGDGVTLTTTGGDITARFVVAADGAASSIARLAGWRETRRLAPALEAEVPVDDATRERLSRAARFDFDVIPAGYGWVFPKARHLSIGVATMLRGGVNLHGVLDAYFSALGIAAAGERHGWLIPYTPRRDGVARRRLLLAGDAAGLADPVTGEGITTALASGRLAARAIMEGGEVEARYEAAVRRAFFGELRVGRVLARLLYQWPRARTMLFRRHGERLTHAMLDVAAGERTYVGSVSNPRNYARLLFGPRVTSPA